MQSKMFSLYVGSASLFGPSASNLKRKVVRSCQILDILGTTSAETSGHRLDSPSTHSGFHESIN